MKLKKVKRGSCEICDAKTGLVSKDGMTICVYCIWEDINAELEKKIEALEKLAKENWGD